MSEKQLKMKMSEEKKSILSISILSNLRIFICVSFPVRLKFYIHVYTLLEIKINL